MNARTHFWVRSSRSFFYFYQQIPDSVQFPVRHQLGASAVVSGRITFDQIKTYLEGGEFFIASQVGLPDPQAAIKKSLQAHVFVEITEIDLQPTDESPTVPVTSQQLIENFRIAGENGWEVRVAHERIGIPIDRVLLNQLRKRQLEVN